MYFFDKIVFFVVFVSLLSLTFGTPSFDSCPGIINDENLTSWGPPPEDSAFLSDDITIVGDCFDFNLSGESVNNSYLLNCAGYTIDTNGDSLSLFRMDNNSLTYLALVSCNVIIDNDVSLMHFTNSIDVNQIYLIDSNVTIYNGEVFYFDNALDSELTLNLGAIGPYSEADFNLQDGSMLFVANDSNIESINVSGLNISDFNSFVGGFDFQYPYFNPHDEGIVFDFYQTSVNSATICLDNTLYITSNDMRSESQTFIRYAPTSDGPNSLDINFCGSNFDVMDYSYFFVNRSDSVDNVGSISLGDFNINMNGSTLAYNYLLNTLDFEEYKLYDANIYFDQVYGIYLEAAGDVYPDVETMDINFSNVYFEKADPGEITGVYFDDFNISTLNYYYDQSNIPEDMYLLKMQGGVGGANQTNVTNCNMYFTNDEEVTTVESEASIAYYAGSSAIYNMIQNLNLYLNNDLNINGGHILNNGGKADSLTVDINADVYYYPGVSEDGIYYYQPMSVQNELVIGGENYYIYDTGYDNDGLIRVNGADLSAVTLDLNSLNLEDNTYLLYWEPSTGTELDINGNNSYVSAQGSLIDVYHSMVPSAITLHDMNVDTTYVLYDNSSASDIDFTIYDSTMQFDSMYYNNGNKYFTSLFYNNIFNTSNEFYFGEFGGEITNMDLNTDFNSERENITGLTGYGGNYWTNEDETGFSDTCNDFDHDGICDESYLVFSYDGTDYYDYLPLAKLSQDYDLNAINLDANAEDINLNDPLLLTFGYKNSGDANASDYNVIFEGYILGSWIELPGCNYYSDQNFVPDDTNDVNCNISSIPFAGEILFRAGFYYEGNDQNIENDFAYETVNVMASDLNAVSISLSDDNISYFDTIDINFVYNSIGSYDANEPYDVLIYADDQLICSETRNDDMLIGDENYYECSWVADLVGTIAITGIVDYSSSDENLDNNSISTELNIEGSEIIDISECPGGAPGDEIELNTIYRLSNDISVDGSCFSVYENEDYNYLIIDCNGNTFSQGENSWRIVTLVDSNMDYVKFMNCNLDLNGFNLVYVESVDENNSINSIIVDDSNINSPSWNTIIHVKNLIVDTFDLDVTNTLVDMGASGTFLSFSTNDTDLSILNNLNLTFTGSDFNFYDGGALFLGRFNTTYLSIYDLNIDVDVNLSSSFFAPQEAEVENLNIFNSVLDINGGTFIANTSSIMNNFVFENTALLFEDCGFYSQQNSPNQTELNFIFDNQQMDINYPYFISIDSNNSLEEITLRDLNVIYTSSRFLHINIDENTNFVPNINIINSDIELNSAERLISLNLDDDNFSISFDGFDLNLYNTIIDTNGVSIFSLSEDDRYDQQIDINEISIYYGTINAVDTSLFNFSLGSINYFNLYNIDANLIGGVYDPTGISPIFQLETGIGSINILDSNIYLGDLSMLLILFTVIEELNLDFNGTNLIASGPDSLGLGAITIFPQSSEDEDPAEPAGIGELTIRNLDADLNKYLIFMADSLGPFSYAGNYTDLNSVNILDSNIDMHDSHLIGLDSNISSDIDFNFNNSNITIDSNFIQITDYASANSPTMFGNLRFYDLNVYSETDNTYLFDINNSIISNIEIYDSLIQLDGLFVVSDANIDAGLIANNKFVDLNELNNTIVLLNDSNIELDFNSIEEPSTRNIINNVTKGGNYWTNLTGTGYAEICVDLDAFGICDEPFDINSNSGTFTDYLALSDNGPDLIAMDINISDEVLPYVEFDINFHFQNVGDRNTTDFNIVYDLYHDNEYVETLCTNWFDWNAELDENYYEVCSTSISGVGDYNILIYFENEDYDKNVDNDSNYLEFSVVSADLSAIEIDFNVNPVQKNEIVDINFVYRNIGNLITSGDYNVSIYIDENLLCSETRSDVLDINDENYFTCDWNFTESDYYDITGIVSYSGIDANADNNSVTETLTVYGQIINDECPGEIDEAMLNEVILLGTDINWVDTCFDINNVNDSDKFFYLDCNNNNIDLTQVGQDFNLIVGISNSNFGNLEIHNCDFNIDIGVRGANYPYDDKTILYVSDSNLSSFILDNIDLNMTVDVFMASFVNSDINTFSVLDSNLDLGNTALFSIRDSNMPQVNIDFTNSNVNLDLNLIDFDVEDFSYDDLNLGAVGSPLFFIYLKDSNVNVINVTNLNMDINMFGEEGSMPYWSLFIYNNSSLTEFNLLDSDIEITNNHYGGANGILYLFYNDQNTFDFNMSGSVFRPIGPSAVFMSYGSNTGIANFNDINIQFSDQMKEPPEDLDVMYNIFFVPFVSLDSNFEQINVNNYQNDFMTLYLFLSGNVYNNDTNMEDEDLYDASSIGEINVSDSDMNLLYLAFVLINTYGDELMLNFNTTTNVDNLLFPTLLVDVNYDYIELSGLNAGLDTNFIGSYFREDDDDENWESIFAEAAVLAISNSDINQFVVKDCNFVYDRLINFNETDMNLVTFYDNYLIDVNEDNNIITLDDSNLSYIDLNATRIHEKNVLGNPWTGGNYWTNIDGTGYSDTCVDSEPDGICDVEYSIGIFSETKLFDAERIDLLPLSDEGADITTSVILGSSTINTGKTVGITVRYTNNGDIDANENFVINVYSNSTRICASPTINTDDVSVGSYDTYTCTSPTYSTNGIYTISSEVDYNGYDTDLSNNDDSKNLTVRRGRSNGGGGIDKNEEDNHAPSIEITNVVVNEADVTIEYSAQDEDGDALEYSIKLDSGNFTKTDNEESYIFYNLLVGTHNLTIKVTDPEGLSAQDTESVIILDSNTDKNESNDQNGNSEPEINENITQNLSDLVYYMKYYQKLGTGKNQIVYVYDKNENALANTRVVISNGTESYTGYTNESGMFVQKILSEGEYSISAKYGVREISGKFYSIYGYNSTEADFVEVGTNKPYVDTAAKSSLTKNIIVWIIILLIIVVGLSIFYYKFIRREKPKGLEHWKQNIHKIRF